mmetsp:Transcript_3855/g.10898  ORF Transcript_3855/g.10898 Transcript_3855/m.10898 type:complete len:357 (-) Transcript_3855:93-1163(-)
MGDWADVHNIKVGLLLDTAADHAYGNARDEIRHIDPLLLGLVDHLLAQLLQIGEGTVQNHTRNGRIPMGVHQTGGGAHRPTPQGDRTDNVGGPQMGNGAHEVLSLVISQAHVLSIGLAAAGKVEAKYRQTEAEQIGQLGQHFDPGAAVAVHVNDDGDAGRMSLDGLPVAALQRHAALGNEGKVGPGESPPAEGKGRRTEGLLLVFRPGRSDDGIDQFLISGLGHLHVRHLLRLRFLLRLLLLLLLIATTSTTAMRSTRGRRRIAGLPIQPSRGSAAAAAAAISVVGRLGHQPFHSLLFSRVLRLAVRPAGTGIDLLIDRFDEVGVIQAHSLKTLEELGLILDDLRAGFVSHGLCWN